MESSTLSAITEDEDLFQSLARSFADKFPGMYDSPCDSNALSGVVHGSDLPQGGVALADTVYEHFHSHMVSVLVCVCMCVAVCVCVCVCGHARLIARVCDVYVCVSVFSTHLLSV